MILFTPQLVLVTADAVRNSRIGHQTYTRGALPSQATASSATATGPADAPLRPDTFEFWQPTVLPATWQFDIGSIQPIDYIGVAGHTLGTEQATLTAETSVDAVSWDLFSFESAPTDDTPIMLLDESRLGRHIRLTVESTTGGGIPRLAVVYVGEVLQMLRSIYAGHSPLPLSRDTVLKRALSRGGQFLGQNFRRNGVAGDAQFRHLTSDWYRDNFDPFVQSARRFPYFFAWRPTDFPTEVAYVWTPGDIKPSNMGKRDLMQVSWPMFGIGHGN